MSRDHVRNALVLGLLVCLGVAVRIGCQDLPNFAPVAGLALFAGYFFRNALLAIAVPVLVMLISDRFIGGYNGAMMFAVYASLALPVAMQWIVRRHADFGSKRLSSIVRTVATVAGCSIVASLLFFLVTNFAVWSFSELYPTTLAGLTTCFTQALPFFRYTFTGDLVFSTLLFGSYAVCVNIATANKPALATS